MVEPRKDPDVNVSKKHNPDISINMIGGTLYRNLGGASLDPTGSPLIGHDGETIDNLDVTAQVVYTRMDDNGWESQSIGPRACQYQSVLGTNQANELCGSNSLEFKLR